MYRKGRFTHIVIKTLFFSFAIRRSQYVCVRMARSPLHGEGLLSCLNALHSCKGEAKLSHTSKLRRCQSYWRDACHSLFIYLISSVLLGEPPS